MTNFSAASKRKIPDSDVDGILHELRRGKKFLVLSHRSPEGDAIGSTLALSFALQDMGKSVYMFNQDSVPEDLRFLPGAEEVSSSIPSDAQFDGICAVDCGDPALFGATFSQWSSSARSLPSTMVIDHHQTNKGFGRWNYVDPDASSTGEMVYRLLKKIPVKITRPIATHIYTAIMTDTGSFRYSNTSPAALKISSEMVAKGADPWEISQHVYERRPLRRIRLLNVVLNTLEVFLGGKAASVTVLREMYDATGSRKEDTEEFVNYPRSIDGVEVGILLRELDQKSFRISLRSRGLVDVARVAQEFGGGGHHNAAGCTIEAGVEEVKRKLLSVISKQLSLS